MAQNDRLSRNTEGDSPWTRTSEEIAEYYGVSPDQGLRLQEAEKRLEQYGPNRLEQKKGKSAWKILLEQFASLIMFFLALAAALSFAFSQWIDGVAIICAMLINAVIGFVTEYKAMRTMEALTRIDKRKSRVLRDGELRKIDASKLVPGDVVHIASGDVITADIRLFEAAKLRINESALTGESLPVGKAVDPVKKKAPLAERSNMVYKGTAVTMGSGKGIVVATGMETEIGTISALTEEAEQESDPLETRLNSLARRLIGVIVGVAALTGISGLMSGREVFLMVETTIVLIVAAIPEGLPVVATVALARGMYLMMKQNALVRRLSAVQTLGSTDVIFTDKTGTLTENQMTVTRLVLPDRTLEISGEGLDTEGAFTDDGQAVSVSEKTPAYRLIETGMLCSNASLRGENGIKEAIGDPMEVALLVAGRKAGYRREALIHDKPEAKEVAFDPEVKMMATYHQTGSGYLVAVKGAPEAVLGVCAAVGEDKEPLSEDQREKWRKKNAEMAAEGLRILAFATKVVDSTDVEPYSDLSLRGYAGIYDPPRKEVVPAIEKCRKAGVKVIMVTGDQAVTAENVGRAVGLIETEDREPLLISGAELGPPDRLDARKRRRIVESAVFYRVSPKQKLDLITTYQQAGSIVGMTGDGVNDAPALKKADIGIAMGKRGEQIARDAADIILRDDSFATILVAIAHGRAIFNNIRKFVIYLISGNMGMILIVGLAAVLNTPLPLLPLQILYMNFINDVFPALALGMSDEGADVLEGPPRDPEEPILTRHNWYTILFYGAIIAASVLGVFWAATYPLGFSQTEAVTVSFVSLAFARLLHVFNMRDTRSRLWDNQVIRNRYVWGALLICVILIGIAFSVPVLSKVLGLSMPGTTGWVLIAMGAFAPLVIGQCVKPLVRRLPQKWHID